MGYKVWSETKQNKDRSIERTKDCNEEQEVYILFKDRSLVSSYLTSLVFMV